MGKLHFSCTEIRNLAICINIKAFNQANKKQLNILKTFLEYLEAGILYFIIVADDYSALKVA